MTPYRLTLVLSLANAVLLVVSLTREHRVAASEPSPVLRGRALELVDDRGRVRAEIRVLPADPNVKMEDGTEGYPETVLLRLISSRGGPNVKLAATEDGAGLVLGGDSAYLQLLSRGGLPRVKLLDKQDASTRSDPDAERARGTCGRVPAGV